jgi:hypothetical protein
MSGKNETENAETSARALTDEELAAAAQIMVRINRKFLTFDAFEDFLRGLLANEFGPLGALRAHHSAKMSGMFNCFYDDPGRWNEIQALALRNLICLNSAESTAFIEGMFKEFLQQRKPEPATEDPNEGLSAESKL